MKKKYQVAKIDNHVLSNLAPDKMANAIDAWIRRLVAKSATPITPDMNDADRVGAIQLRREARETFDRYIEMQREMFAAHRLDRELVWTTAIVPTGVVLANGVEVCKIVKRKTELMLDDRSEEAHAALRKENQLESAKLGFDRPMTGKYRDADRIIAQEIDYINSLSDL